MKKFEGEVDVCVVGSGAGGGAIAYALSRAGASVVVLEKGPWYTRDDYVRDEILTCRRTFWQPNVTDEPRVHFYTGRPDGVKQVDSWGACCVGGGTAHMSGFVYRLDPADFNLATRYGGIDGSTLADWPITYEDLAPYYDRVEAEVGVSGKAGAHPFEPPRTGPYPFEPLHAHPLSALIDKAGAELGLHPFETPRMILTKGVGDRMACHYHRTCGSYGCETGARGSSAAALLPPAIRTNRCEVRPHCMVYQVIAKDGRATAVRYVDAAGKNHEQKARVIVVSATAIESARLLLSSELANESGQLGNNLNFSTFAKGSASFASSKLPPEAMSSTVPFLQRSIRDHYFLGTDGYDKGGTLNYILPHANPIFTAERLSRRGRPRLWGSALLESLEHHYRDVREIEVEVFAEFLPTPGTKVQLSKSVQDKWGRAVAEVHLDAHPAARENSKTLVNRGLAVLEAAGGDRVVREAWGQTTWVLQHGTCRFGTDPATSVLDPNCKVHELDNLYVVDGSFLPTSGGVPTTLTIMANALRVGDHLAERFVKRELK